MLRVFNKRIKTLPLIHEIHEYTPKSDQIYGFDERERANCCMSVYVSRLCARFIILPIDAATILAVNSIHGCADFTIFEIVMLLQCSLYNTLSLCGIWASLVFISCLLHVYFMGVRTFQERSSFQKIFWIELQKKKRY